MAGATSLFVPGPAQIAIGPSGGALSYLGTTVNGARGRSILYTGNVQGDPAGVDGMPLDVRISGIGIVMTCQLNKFDPAVMTILEGRYYGGSAMGGAGSVIPNAIGSLMLVEQLSFAVVIRSPYSLNKTQYMNFYPGIRILYAIVNGEIGKDYSTKEQTVDLTFMGLTKMDTSTLSGVCWNIDVSGFPTPT